VKADLPPAKARDAARGKEAFETRGCMACHSMGEGAAKQGGTFAANLSREGEKANYDYLVRWVAQSAAALRAVLHLREEGHYGPQTTNARACPYVFDLEAQQVSQ